MPKVTMSTIFWTVIVLFLLALFITGASFFSGGLNLAYNKVFKPANANVEREVFENTQSYTQGKTADLAKKYGEYMKTDSMADKAMIESLIKMEFADFDPSKLNNYELKAFLIKVRGY